MSTGLRTGGDNVAVLLRELYEARAEMRYWKRRARELERSRDHWRSEARAWKWGASQR